VDQGKIQTVSKDQLKDADKAEFEAHMKRSEELCLASYGQTKSEVYMRILFQCPSRTPSHLILKGFKI
jgi:hypothetical protein